MKEDNYKFLIEMSKKDFIKELLKIRTNYRPDFDAEGANAIYDYLEKEMKEKEMDFHFKISEIKKRFKQLTPPQFLRYFPNEDLEKENKIITVNYFKKSYVSYLAIDFDETQNNETQNNETQNNEKEEFLKQINQSYVGQFSLADVKIDERGKYFVIAPPSGRKEDDNVHYYKVYIENGHASKIPYEKPIPECLKRSDTYYWNV